MKKSLFALMAMGVSLTAVAQQPTLSGKVAKDALPENITWKRGAQSNGMANKGAGVGGSRWYSQFDELDAFVYSGDLTTNERVIPIWFDSTVRQAFTSGLGTINYSGIGQVIDPVGSTFFNSKVNHKGQIQVTSTTPYVVDSVRFGAFYSRLASRPSTIVDTLILSVTANKITYYWLRTSTNPVVTQYLPNGKDTLWGSAPTKADSVNRAAFADDGTTRYYVKIPLRATDTIFNQSFFSYPVNGTTGLTIPAGYRVAVTATFKSGDTWTKNVDSITKFSRWMPGTSEPVKGAQMPYYYYSNNDRSMSSMLFSTDSSFYIPSVIVEAINTVSFANEFHDVGVHIKCPTCSGVVVNSVSEEFTRFGGLPNPASTEFYVPFTLKSNSGVVVTIANSVGQVVLSKDMGNVSTGTARFDISALANGVYFYTVNAGGIKATERMVVAH